MDEVAFVESLFSPEMRSTPLPSPCFDGISPQGLRLATPASALPLRSVGKWPIAEFMRESYTPTTASAAVHAADDPVFMRMHMAGQEDDEAFCQLLNEHDFDDSLQMPALLDLVPSPPSSGGGFQSHPHQHQQPHHPPHSMYHNQHNLPPSLQSFLLEPLDLPKSGGGGMNRGNSSDFLPFVDTPTMSQSPVQRFGAQSLRPTIGNMGYSYSHVQQPQHRHVPHRPETVDYNIGLPPSSGLMANGDSNSLHAIQALQSAIWSDSSAGLQRLPPNSIKHVIMATQNNMGIGNSLSSSPTSSTPMALPAPAPSSASNGPAMTAPMPANLWISTSSMLNVPTSQLASNFNEHKQPKKRAKTRPADKASMSMASAALIAAHAAAAISNSDSSPTKSVYDQDSSSSRLSVCSNTSDDGSKAKGKKCVEPTCNRRAQSNSRCKAHGGGARCQYAGPEGCTRSSQGGGYCRAHGGGKRCEFPGCERGQQRKGRCYVHGGIRKCQMGDCQKKDRGNGFCIAHGGGKRCQEPGCTRAVRRGLVCQLHE